jgi:hypothetical protein
MYRDDKWHTRLAREYLREVDKFRKLLLFCVHVTGRVVTNQPTSNLAMRLVDCLPQQGSDWSIAPK